MSNALNGPADDQEIATLRQNVDERMREFDSAVAHLGRLSSAKLTIGGHVARHPWRWLLGACAVGLVASLVQD